MPAFDRNAAVVGMLTEHHSASDRERASGRRIYNVGPWIDHDGGEMPVAADSYVQCLHPGSVGEGPGRQGVSAEPGPPIMADNLSWKDRRAHHDSAQPHHGNIVRYRVVQFPAPHRATFTNEHGAEVAVWAEYRPLADIFCDGVLLAIQGRHSVHEHYITLMEAREMHRALSAVLGAQK
jgi:hypothetical protein